MESYIKYSHSLGETIITPLNVCLKNIILPDCQRYEVPGKVEQIKDSLIFKYEKSGGILFVDAFTVAKLDDVYYLLDGQHRLKTYELLSEEGYVLPHITCSVSFVKSREELNELFCYCNSRSNIANLFFKDLDGKNSIIIKDAVHHLTLKYKKNIFRLSARPHVPHTTVARMEDAINDASIIDKLNIKTADELFNKIVAYELIAKDIFRCENNYEKCSAKHCFFRCKSDEKDYFINMCNYYQIKNKIKSTKVSLSTRNKLWERDCKDGFGKCFCCEKVVRKDDFHAGHIKPACDGGLGVLNNLEVLCVKCNQSMGGTNLHEYMYNNGKKNKLLRNE